VPRGAATGRAPGGPGDGRGATGTAPGLRLHATPHTFDSVLVDCVHPLEPDEAGGDDTARDVAFVWRDPAVALPGA
jgi:hypothetical protein